MEWRDLVVMVEGIQELPVSGSGASGRNEESMSYRQEDIINILLIISIL